MNRQISYQFGVSIAALGITLLIGWEPNVQVLGTCAGVPSICAESDSLGIVAVPTPDCQGQSIVWSTHTTGVPEQPAILDPVRWVWAMRRTMGWRWL